MLYRLARPLLFQLDAERAHRQTIAALKRFGGRSLPQFDPILATSVAGLHFPSPVGLAAGFDKDAEVPDAMLSLGFGFVEVGTLTPRPQAGNSRPRLFRLPRDQAVINRMGFNNRGQDAALSRLANRPRRGIVGVNIGANKDSASRIADYVKGVAAMAPVADYLTVNISSPNTPGLRRLQDEGALRELLAAVQAARGPAPSPSPADSSGPPIFLKVAPDLGAGEPDQIVRIAIAHGIDGLIVANTTVSRPPLQGRHAGEAGGLSGQPLAPLAMAALRNFRSASGGELPLIAVGGIGSADEAWQRIRAGACLVQLYSALVFQGPGLARQIAAGLVQRLRAGGFASIAEAVGTG